MTSATPETPRAAAEAATTEKPRAATDEPRPPGCRT